MKFNKAIEFSDDHQVMFPPFSLFADFVVSHSYKVNHPTAFEGERKLPQGSQKGHTNTTQSSDVVCHSVSSSSAGNVHVAYDPGPANDNQSDKQGKQSFRKLALAARSFP